ncbi:MAG TPA: hypothetical protein PKD54_08485 [Pirellulaceae bacterium]|nr:hypothetical protein [Pirellulaceae bacterium]
MGIQHASAWATFGSGFLWGVLAIASVNALSYFYYSSGWGNLFGTQTDAPVAIGFPWLIWHNGIGFDQPTHRPAMVWANAVAGLLLSAVIGAAAVFAGAKRSSTPERPQVEKQGLFQFRLVELMAATGLVGLILADTEPTGNWPGKSMSMARQRCFKARKQQTTFGTTVPCTSHWNGLTNLM